MKARKLPDSWRYVSFRFALNPTAAQQRVLARHAGASRFAYNQGLALISNALHRRRVGEQVRVPWSAFDLINAFNAWKRSPDAGTPGGLAWRREVCAEVFEEAMVDLARGVSAFSNSSHAVRDRDRVGFPRHKRKGRCVDSFRMRQRSERGTGRMCIRIGGSRPRLIALPRIGALRVHDDTRKLRRLQRRGARILFATVSRRGARWFVTLNVAAPPFAEQQRHHDPDAETWIGIDRGLKLFAVVATAGRIEMARIAPCRPLDRDRGRLRRAHREHSRKRRGSRNRARSARRLGVLESRIADRRRSFTHQVSTQLTKTHGRLAFENLGITEMVRNRRLSRQIHDAGWGMFADQLLYKQLWRGGRVVRVDRYYPSSKRCSDCGIVRPSLRLGDRTFRCPKCGLCCDRDLNAAANLAAWAEAHAHAVAVKHPETQNARGEEGSGSATERSETGLCEAGTPPAA